MNFDDLHPQDDYSHRFFIWHEWIQANGPLSIDNVFDYFATSMFYDKQSNNQVLRMQTMHTGQPIANEAEELKRFTGIEFAVVHAQPPSLFVIHKRERLSREEVRPLAAYFIINNRIYQSPDVYTIISNRLLTTVHSLQTSLNILRTYRPDFTPRTGFAWPIATSADESRESKAADEFNEESIVVENDEAGIASLNSTDSPDTRSRMQQNFLPLFNAMRTTAAHSATTFTQGSSDFPTSVTISPLDSGITKNIGTRSSSTPVPTSEFGPSVPAPEVPSKAPPGGGKKKRKRMSNAPSAT